MLIVHGYFRTLLATCVEKDYHKQPGRCNMLPAVKLQQGHLLVPWHQPHQLAEDCYYFRHRQLALTCTFVLA